MVVGIPELLHLRRADIDSVSLSSTTHGEVLIERGELNFDVFLGNDLNFVVSTRDEVREG